MAVDLRIKRMYELHTTTGERLKEPLILRRLNHPPSIDPCFVTITRLNLPNRCAGHIVIHECFVVDQGIRETDGLSSRDFGLVVWIRPSAIEGVSAKQYSHLLLLAMQT